VGTFIVVAIYNSRPFVQIRTGVLWKVLKINHTHLLPECILSGEGFYTCVPARKLGTIEASSNRRTSVQAFLAPNVPGARRTQLNRFQRVSNRSFASYRYVRNCAAGNSGSQMWDPATCGSN
jgi:hypothetical protein